MGVVGLGGGGWRGLGGGFVFGLAGSGVGFEDVTGQAIRAGLLERRLRHEARSGVCLACSNMPWRKPAPYIIPDHIATHTISQPIIPPSSSQRPLWPWSGGLPPAPLGPEAPVRLLEGRARIRSSRRCSSAAPIAGAAAGTGAWP